MIDIDRFKQVNDTFGHPVGDCVLELLAHDLTSRLRATDHVARWGGEEFLVVLPDTDRAGAVTVLDEVREFVARARDEVPDFTVSVGVAQWQHGQAPEDLVAHADRKLYEAKQAGRNCTLA
jgi:diguanylate cyclase (GGDEF)-like protein